MKTNKLEELKKTQCAYEDNLDCGIYDNLELRAFISTEVAKAKIDLIEKRLKETNGLLTKPQVNNLWNAAILEIRKPLLAELATLTTELESNE